MIVNDEYKNALKLFNNGNTGAAIIYLQRALQKKPRHQRCVTLLIKALSNEKRYSEALEYLDQLDYKANPEAKQLRLDTLLSNKKYSEVETLLWEDYKKSKDDFDLFKIHEVKIKRGETEEALKLLHEIYKRNPKKEGVLAKTIINEHFNPNLQLENIRNLQKEWEKHFSYKNPQQADTKRSLDRVLRVGILSDGFHNHPVTRMTSAGFLGLPKNEFHLYAYSSSDESDHMTIPLKKACQKWRQIGSLPDKELNALIRKDRIDILVDLSGYHKGSRLQALSLRPAPIIIKWVGGLLNTMGLSFIDYLISDKIESPIGSDGDYAEKLIRMPHSYICYTPPYYVPDTCPPPVLKEGRIKFGCFNNANKINSVVIRSWSEILKSVENSSLLLKGSLYESEEFQDRIIKAFGTLGVASDRIQFEGQSPHRELLETYNKVDITLDPWPFSGGLTTLESILMGVPVVTYPGPTFASRHSASHVSNSGFPELVADSWENYVGIATMLAHNPKLLTQLRSEMRDIFLNSHICNKKEFSQNLRKAFLSIWNRHCDGKAPAALHFDQNHRAVFEDEQQTRVEENVAATLSDFEFSFDLESPVVVVDHGARLVCDEKFTKIYDTNGVHVICFDPAHLAKDILLPVNKKRLQLVNNVILGDGNSVDFHANVDNQLSGTLDPEDSLKKNILTSLQLSSVKLDNLPRDEDVDWLMLSDNYSNASIIQHGSETLTNALVVSIKINFDPWAKGRLNLDQAMSLIKPLGFTFHTLMSFDFSNEATDGWMKENQRGSKVISAIAVFVKEEIDNLSETRLEKILFILHSYFGAYDLVQRIMNKTGHSKLGKYIDYFEKEDVRNISIPDTPSMSEKETDLFESYLIKAERYFEFGSGGSSKLAASLGLTVNGVESDKKWLTRLKMDLGAKSNIEYIDIGPTGEWGYPTDLSAEDRFPRYSESINSTDKWFDFILIDGRFRVACTLETVKNILINKKEDRAVIFIHDFRGRDYYNPVLEYLDEIDSVESAVVFKVKNNIDREKLEETITFFNKDYR